MNISKIFFYDFLNKRKIKRMMIFWVMLAIIASSVLKEVQLSSASAGAIGIMIASVSSLYTLSSYATLEKLRFYVSLPIQFKKLIFSLIAVLYISTLFEKLSLFIIAAFFIYTVPLVMIAYAMASAFFSTMVIVSILLAMNVQHKILLMTNSLMLVGMMYTSIIFSDNLMYWLLAQFIVLIIPVITLLTLDSAYLIVNRQVQGRAAHSILRKNYFLLTIMAEKVFVVNTVFIFAAVIAFVGMFPSNSIMTNLAWGMGAINTPAMTMLSGDKWIAKQADMLPETKKSIGKMYVKFLFGYFAVVNVIIVATMSLKDRTLEWKNVLLVIVVSVVETVATILLEKKWRLTDWQIRKELWRHPRKYIPPVIIFVFMSAVSIILT